MGIVAIYTLSRVKNDSQALSCLSKTAHIGNWGIRCFTAGGKAPAGFVSGLDGELYRRALLEAHRVAVFHG